jgi:hypothetical protein
MLSLVDFIPYSHLFAFRKFFAFLILLFSVGTWFASVTKTSVKIESQPEQYHTIRKEQVSRNKPSHHCQTLKEGKEKMYR